MKDIAVMSWYARHRDVAQLLLGSVGVAIIYVIVLSVVFPGYFDPFWPIHSDQYMFLPAPARWLEDLAAGVPPRPLGFFVAALINIAGLRTGLVLNAAIVLLNVAMTVVVLQRLLQLRRLHIVGFTVYVFCLIASPYFYISHLYDNFAHYEYALVIVAMLFWLTPQPTTITVRRAAVVCVLCFLSSFCKETYIVGLGFLWLWLGLRSRCRVAYTPLISLGVGAISAIALLRLSNSNQLSGQGSYQLASDLSVVATTWWRYIQLDLALPTLLGLTTATLAWILAKRSLLILLPVVSGLLTLLPNSVIPNHFLTFYSWTSLPLLLAPLLLIGDELLPELPPRRLLAAFAPTTRYVPWLLGTAVIVMTPGHWLTAYTTEGWTLDRQLEQKMSIQALGEINRSIPVGSRIRVSGLSTVFHPFQWPAFASSQIPNAADIEFVVNDANLAEAVAVRWRARHTNVRIVLASEVDKTDSDSVDAEFVFDSQGSLLTMARSHE